MKLLFDENLSPHLVERLADVYPESKHVSGVELGAAQDSAVWEYAKRHGFAAIVSKDSDFAERSVLESGPPKVIWIRLGNCTTADIEGQLRSAHEVVRAFLEKDEETCLMLGRVGIAPGVRWPCRVRGLAGCGRGQASRRRREGGIFRRRDSGRGWR